MVGHRRIFRAAPIATALVMMLVGCGSGSADQRGDVELLRIPATSTVPTGTESGYLDASSGCLHLIGDDGDERSLVFDGALDLYVSGGRLYVNGSDQGAIGSGGIHVTLRGREGPVSYSGSEVEGPADRPCNQTNPWQAAQILSAPAS